MATHAGLSVSNRWVQIAGLAIAYLIAGKLALLLAIPPGYATAVWPAAGIALAGLLLFGSRVWPGVFLGSFLVNIGTAFATGSVASMLQSTLLSTGIAGGAVLQALLGAWLISRLVGFPIPLDRIQEVFRAMALGGPVSCLVSASIGVACLLATGQVPPGAAWSNGWTWWLGDSLGVLVALPLVAIWKIELSRQQLRARLQVLIPLGLVIAVTVLLFFQVRAGEWGRAQLIFERRTDHLGQALKITLTSYREDLSAIEGLFMASREVERGEFALFVKGMLQRHPGIQVLEWVPRVPAAERELYQQRAQADGFGDFRILQRNASGELVPATDRPEYYPVYFLEPLPGNEPALGFDLASNPERLAALDQARVTAAPVASARIKLVQEVGEQFGVLLFHPIFGAAGAAEPVAGSAKLLLGYVVGVFRVGDLVREALQAYDLVGISYRLLDQASEPAEVMLLDEDGEPWPQAGAERSRPGLHSQVAIDFGGRRWSMEFRPTAAYLAELDLWEARRVLTGGLLFASLLGTLLLVVTGRSAMVARVVEERTAELHRVNAALAQEVAERGAMAEALQESEGRHRAIVDTAVDGIITIDEQGIVQSFNAAAERIFGYPPEAVIGHNVKMLQPEPYRSEHDDYLRNYLRSGQKKIIGIGREVVGLRRDGTTFPLDLSVSEVALDTRRLFTGIIRDISDRKQAEAELRIAKEQAEAANQAKSEFLASMSHEIRTPMNAIIGMAELLSETKLEPEQREYVRIFQSAGESLLTLINDILDLSKLEAGQFALESIDFDLRDMLEKTCQILALRAHKKGLELACRLAPEAPEQLVGDPLRLRQVLVNLVGNAMKFTEQGEVVVEVQPVAPPGPGEDVELRFAVSDTGIGIPADKLQLIFERFSQVDASTTRKYGGTGLGLNISQRIVAAMGGEIQVESEVGRGSTFSFSARFGQPAIAEAPPPSPLVDLQGLRTLVVDDCPTNRLVLREMLAVWGAEIIEVADGPEAIDAMQQAREKGESFDLVLLDCRMPGMDGFEVVQQVQRDQAFSGTTVMMLTSDNRVGDLARARALGISGYMVKPIKRDELIEAIGSARAATLEPQPSRAEPETAETPARPLQILLVDDSEDNRLLVTAFLKKTAHTLDQAKDGQQAVELFQAGHYDLVLMDMQMPVKDGYAATREIRQWEEAEKRGPTPIIALTAYALAADVQKSLDAGCTTHLSKPIKKELLLQTLTEFSQALADKGGTDDKTT